MAEKELRRMCRQDLIEIIYELRKNEERLQLENESLKQQLKVRQTKIEKAGSLAELSASLNGLFESAQATADQYLREIRMMTDDLNRTEPGHNGGESSVVEEN